MPSDYPIRRFVHTIEFKNRLVGLCRQPGTSVAAVALAHGLNANLLRRWIKRYQAPAPIPIAATSAKLVPIQVDVPAADSVSSAIELEIQRGSAHVSIRWPAAAPSACAQWLGAWLK